MFHKWKGMSHKLDRFRMQMEGMLITPELWIPGALASLIEENWHLGASRGSFELATLSLTGMGRKEKDCEISHTRHPNLPN